nr:ATP-binding protein [Streptomyces sp. CBMA123]
MGNIRNLLASRVAQAGIVLDEFRAYALRVGSSELFGNAIKYRGPVPPGSNAVLLIEGDVDQERGRLRITFTNPGQSVPTMNSRVDDLDATSGRGLVVVAGYADDVGWGQRLDPEGGVDGWSVWFELEVQELPDFGQATAEAEVQPDDSVSTQPRRLHAARMSAVRKRLTKAGWPLRRAREWLAA